MKNVELNIWLYGLLVIAILFAIILVHTTNPPIAAILITATILIIELVQLFRGKLLGIFLEIPLCF